LEYAEVVKCNQSKVKVGIEGSINMDCRCERLMVLCFVIGILFSGMMNGALAGRHVTEGLFTMGFKANFLQIIQRYII